MTSTLSFDFGGSSFSRVFQIYSANPYGVEYFRREHESIKGVLAEDSVGYRLLFDIDFKPLAANKQDSYWMSLFMAGMNRQVTVDDTYYAVTIPQDELNFDFYDSTYFANAFTLHFVEKGIRTITDTASTRILKPQYTHTGQGISGETLTIMVNLYDEYSVGVIKHNLEFVNENKNDIAWAYRHLLNIDFGYIKDFTYRTWLIEFALWGSKQIDGTAIDSLNGKVYNMIFGEQETRFPFSNGVKDAITCKMLFKEKNPHTDFEEFTAPTPFILDHTTFGVLDKNYLG
jgi:hypothetical protein